jgi:hypothetical protein
MKNQVAIAFFTLLLISCGNGGEVPAHSDQSDERAEPIDSFYCNCDELILDQPYNHFWRFERRKGFTGKCEEFYPDGTLKTTKNLVEGKLHGKLFTYYKNGRMHEEKEFDMNFQTGEHIIYTNTGEVKLHALYRRGKLTEILVNKPDVLEEDPWATPN